MKAHQPRWLVAGFALALLLTLFFAGHALWTVTHLRDSHAPVEDWMTPGYVVRVYDIPPETLAETLGVEPKEARGRTLEDLAEERGIPAQALVGAVQALVAP
jgi:hypothetical protein